MLHFDEARNAAIAILRRTVGPGLPLERAVLIEDISGRLRVLTWDLKSLPEDAKEALVKQAAPWWTGEFWDGDNALSGDTFADDVWSEASPDDQNAQLRILARHRTRNEWFQDAAETVWALEADSDAPPVVVFYSFKGGVGRSTTLASFAMQRASKGERVVVVDFDLDAPGIGVLLSTDEKGTQAQWGTVDYLLERPTDKRQVADYFHVCRRPEIAGAGEIIVMPAGRLDADYLDKLSRVEFGRLGATEAQSPIIQLLRDIKEQYSPQWILIDSRTGLSDSSGALLGGFAHLHVLMSTTSEQNWHGIGLVLDKLGGVRVRKGLSQSECLLVQAMAPAPMEGRALAVAQFAARSSDEFRNHYYAESVDDSNDDRFWDIRDLETADAPHVPGVLPYRTELSHFTDLAQVVAVLCESDYADLAARISARFDRDLD